MTTVHRVAMLSIGFGLLFFFAGCASTPEAQEQSLGHKYKFSFDFMWDQVRSELREQYPVADADHDLRKITTEWDENLHPFSTFGTRKRLVVEIKGDIVDGFEVVATEEAQLNSEQKNPLSSTDAKWEPDDANGRSAAVFLYGLHRRLNPSQDWRGEPEDVEAIPDTETRPVNDGQ